VGVWKDEVGREDETGAVNGLNGVARDWDLDGMERDRDSKGTGD
jgi:hypothetical protein